MHVQVGQWQPPCHALMRASTASVVSTLHAQLANELSCEVLPHDVLGFHGAHSPSRCTNGNYKQLTMFWLPRSLPQLRRRGADVSRQQDRVLQHPGRPRAHRLPSKPAGCARKAVRHGACSTMSWAVEAGLRAAAVWHNACCTTAG